MMKNSIQLLVLENRSLPSAVLLKDLNGGSNHSYPVYLTATNNILYFQATDGISGFELWKSDGTAAGTVMVKDIVPGSGSSIPSNLININGTLYFSANVTSAGWELWKSDGTESGTVMVKDIVPGATGSFPSYLTNVNGTLYFKATDALGAELWKSDGTESGTVQVKDIGSGSTGSSPSQLFNVNGTLFFVATDLLTTGTELWKSDGTAAGTALVKDIRPGTGTQLISQLTNVSGTLFFYASDGVKGQELWKSDGTEAGTVMVKDIRTGTSGSTPRQLTNINGLLYFSANDGPTGSELWKSDGTEAGTVLVKDIYPGAPTSSIGSVTNVGGVAFFRANDGVSGPELWKSDGTAAGTVLVKDIKSGNAGYGNPSIHPGYFANVSGTLYFTAFSDTSGAELWKSDGTAAGTVLVKDIYTGTQGSLAESLTNVNGTLFFVAQDGVTGYEIWKIETPTVTSLSASSGSNAGGQQVVISGSGFNDVTQVKFGSTNAASFVVNSATQITATVPAGTGTVGVSVTTSTGTSTLANAYTYTAASATLNSVTANGLLSSFNNPTTTYGPVPLTDITTSSGYYTFSRIVSLELTFSDAVYVDEGALTLYVGDTLLNATYTLSNDASGAVVVGGNGSSTIQLTFAAANFDGLEGRSLQNGIWKLQVDFTKLRIGSSSGPSAGTNAAFLWHEQIRRLFGDANGDGNVGPGDFTAFGTVYTLQDTDPDFSPFFNSNDNSSIDPGDFTAFGTNFGQSL